MVALLYHVDDSQLATDPRLGGNLVYKRRLVPVEEALADIGKKVGVRLECVRSLKERKVIVLVDGTSTARTLMRLADVLRSNWEASEKGYRLVQSPKKAAQERDAARALGGSDDGRLESGLRALAATPNIPRKLLAAQVEKASFAARGSIRIGEAASAESIRLNRIASDLSRALEEYDLAYVLRQLDAEGWRRLLGGGLVSAGKGTLYTMPDDEAAPERMYLQRDPAGGSLRTRAQSTIPGGQGAIIKHTYGIAAPVVDSIPARDLQNEISAWSTGATTLKDLPLSVKVPTPKAWAWSGRLTHPDRLEWVHQAGGVPIVGIADRQVETREPRGRYPTLGTFLRTYDSEGTFHEEDGFLMYRPYAFYASREPSEGWFRRLEATPQPTLETYAILTAELSRGTQLPSHPMIQTSVCPTPFSAEMALRFLGTLSPNLRERLLRNGSVDRNELAGPARDAFDETIVGGLFGGGWAYGRLLDELARPEWLVGKGLGVIGGDSENVLTETVASDPYLDFSDRKGYVRPEPDLRLAFGFGSEDAMVYLLYRRGLPSSARPKRFAP